MSGRDNFASISGVSTPADQAYSCGCIGPQNGKPYCPCRMRGVTQRDGRWIERERDLGPVLPVYEPPKPVEPIGCICPPTSEKTCERPTCPRRGIRVSIVASTPSTVGASDV